MTWGGLFVAAEEHAHEITGVSAEDTPTTSSTSDDDSFVMVCPSQSPAACHTKLVVGGLALVGVGAAIGYFVARRAACQSRINHKVHLGKEKVADMIDVEDIGEKKAFCRCWKSEKFPYCDGSHGKHNKETGDNVGPLVVKGKAQ